MMKTMKKLLALVLTFVMAFSVASITAFAAADEGNESGTTAKKAPEVYISKTYNAAVGRAFTFEFNAAQEVNDAAYNKTPVAVTIPAISFTENETGTTSKFSQLVFETYPEEGIYKYIVTENQTVEGFTADDNHKLVMSKQKYMLEVYVVTDENGNTSIEDVVISSPKTGDDGSETYEKTDIIHSGENNKPQDDGGSTGGEGGEGSNLGKNKFNFENTYYCKAGTGEDGGSDEDKKNYEENGSLRIGKEVVGVKGIQNWNVDTKQDFTFTAEFTFPAGTDAASFTKIQSKIVKTPGLADSVAVDNDTLSKEGFNDVTLTTNNTCEFTLRPNQSIVFVNLPAGTEVNVKENATTHFRPSASIVMNGGEAQSVTKAGFSKDLNIKRDVEGSNQATYVLGLKKNTVDVTNTFMKTPVTGVIVNALPFVMMIAIASAGLFLFVALKRRENESEEA